MPGSRKKAKKTTDLKIATPSLTECNYFFCHQMIFF